MYKIKFDTIDQVKTFVKEIEHLGSDAIIRTTNRKYAVDAKSLMGIFSLDLSNYLLLDVYDDNNHFAEMLDRLDITNEKLEEV